MATGVVGTTMVVAEVAISAMVAEAAMVVLLAGVSAEGSDTS